MMARPLRLAATLLLVAAVLAAAFSSASSASVRLRTRPRPTADFIGKCEECKKIIGAFMAGFEKTRGGNFGGGNTVWENKRLPKWDASETRLAEVMEGVCDEDDEQCFRTLNRVEDDINDWWLTDNRDAVSLHKLICVDRERVCCQEGHGGADCAPCPTDAAGSVCSGRGSCPFSGYRQEKKPFACECHAGYTGELCTDCKSGFLRLPDTATCQPCSPACDGNCTGLTTLDCLRCAPGYYRADADGACTQCHASCRTCTGGGETACVDCASGHHWVDSSKVCVDVDECTEMAEPCPGTGRLCVNYPGSFYCDCEPGYRPKGTSECEPVEPAKEDL